jgi:hypothetical protein
MPPDILGNPSFERVLLLQGRERRLTALEHPRRARHNARPSLQPDLIALNQDSHMIPLTQTECLPYLERDGDLAFPGDSGQVLAHTPSALLVLPYVIEHYHGSTLL